MKRQGSAAKRKARARGAALRSSVFERWADLDLGERVDLAINVARGIQRAAHGRERLATGRITFVVSTTGYELDFDLTPEDDAPDRKCKLAFDWPGGAPGYDPAKAKALVQRLLRIAYAGKRRQD